MVARMAEGWKVRSQLAAAILTLCLLSIPAVSLASIYPESLDHGCKDQRLIAVDVFFRDGAQWVLENQTDSDSVLMEFIGGPSKYVSVSHISKRVSADFLCLHSPQRADIYHLLRHAIGVTSATLNFDNPSLEIGFHNWNEVIRPIRIYNYLVVDMRHGCRCYSCVVKFKFHNDPGEVSPLIEPRVCFPFLMRNVSSGLSHSDFTGNANCISGRLVGLPCQQKGEEKKGRTSNDQVSLILGPIGHFTGHLLHTFLDEKRVYFPLVGLFFAALAGIGGGLVLDYVDPQRWRRILGAVLFCLGLPLAFFITYLGFQG